MFRMLFAQKLKECHHHNDLLNLNDLIEVVDEPDPEFWRTLWNYTERIADEEHRAMLRMDMLNNPFFPKSMYYELLDHYAEPVLWKMSGSDMDERIVDRYIRYLSQKHSALSLLQPLAKKKDLPERLFDRVLAAFREYNVYVFSGAFAALLRTHCQNETRMNKILSIMEDEYDTWKAVLQIDEIPSSVLEKMFEKAKTVKDSLNRRTLLSYIINHKNITKPLFDQIVDYVVSQKKDDVIQKSCSTLVEHPFCTKSQFKRLMPKGGANEILFMDDHEIVHAWRSLPNEDKQKIIHSHRMNHDLFIRLLNEHGDEFLNHFSAKHKNTYHFVPKNEQETVQWLDAVLEKIDERIHFVFPSKIGDPDSNLLGLIDLPDEIEKDSPKTMDRWPKSLIDLAVHHLIDYLKKEQSISPRHVELFFHVLDKIETHRIDIESRRADLSQIVKNMAKSVDLNEILKSNKYLSMKRYSIFWPVYDELLDILEGTNDSPMRGLARTLFLARTLLKDDRGSHKAFLKAVEYFSNHEESMIFSFKNMTLRKNIPLSIGVNIAVKFRDEPLGLMMMDHDEIGPLIRRIMQVEEPHLADEVKRMIQRQDARNEPVL